MTYKSTHCKKRKNLDQDGFCPTCVIQIAKKKAVMDWPCGVCTKSVAVGEMAMYCDSCDIWSHITCIGMTEEAYEILTSGDKGIKGVSWYCPPCKEKVKEAIEKFNTLEKRTVSLQEQMVEVKQTLVNIDNSVKKIVHNEITESVNERNEIEKRKLNLIVYGLPEPMDTNSEWDNAEKIEEDQNAIESLIKDDLGVGLSPRCGIIECRRLGRKDKAAAGKVRPLRLTFTDIHIKRDVLGNGKNLRKSDNPIAKKVYISPDLTPAQRKIENDLRDEMWRLRESGKKVIIQKGKIIETTRDIRMTRPQSKQSNTVQNDKIQKAATSGSQSTI